MTGLHKVVDHRRSLAARVVWVECRASAAVPLGSVRSRRLARRRGSRQQMYEIFSNRHGIGVLRHSRTILETSNRNMSPVLRQCRWALLVGLLAAVSVCGSLVPLTSLNEAERSFAVLSQRPGPLFVFVFDSRYNRTVQPRHHHTHSQHADLPQLEISPLVYYPIALFMRAALKRRPKPRRRSPPLCATCVPRRSLAAAAPCFRST